MSKSKLFAASLSYLSLSIFFVFSISSLLLAPNPVFAINESGEEVSIMRDMLLLMFTVVAVLCGFVFYRYRAGTNSSNDLTFEDRLNAAMYNLNRVKDSKDRNQNEQPEVLREERQGEDSSGIDDSGGDGGSNDSGSSEN